MISVVKQSWGRWLPFVFIVVAALSRWPGLFPPNFSAFYGLAFCAGAFFPTRMKWWLPLGTLLVTDLILNFFFYHMPPKTYQLVNYVAYAGLILFGSRFSHKSPFLHLLTGGILGALAFYLLTNTAAWLFNPFGNREYTKDVTGWITALTLGTKGHPTTLEFLKNTLLSGGLFTGLFAGAMKLTEAAESIKEKGEEAEAAKDTEAEPEPEEA